VKNIVVRVPDEASVVVVSPRRAELRRRLRARRKARAAAASGARKGPAGDIVPMKLDARDAVPWRVSDVGSTWGDGRPTATARVVDAKKPSRKTPKPEIDSGTAWVDQSNSPLGRRKHLRLCREGVFPSARKLGKQWLVMRAELDAFIIGTDKPANSTHTDDIDRELAALGMVES
jgi:hypothetical protein